MKVKRFFGMRRVTSDTESAAAAEWFASAAAVCVADAGPAAVDMAGSPVPLFGGGGNACCGGWAR